MTDKKKFKLEVKEVDEEEKKTEEETPDWALEGKEKKYSIFNQIAYISQGSHVWENELLYRGNLERWHEIFNDREQFFQIPSYQVV